MNIFNGTLKLRQKKESKTIIMPSKIRSVGPDLGCYGNQSDIFATNQKMYFIHRVFTFQGC